MTIRAAFVHLHRWVGLSIAGFLVIAGLTGTLIAFEYELDVLLNPDLLRSETAGTHLPLPDLAAEVEAYDPRLKIVSVDLYPIAGKSVEFFVRGKDDPETGKAIPLGYAQLYADPVTGEILGTRARDGCCSRQTIMRFIHVLHHTLQGGQFWRDVMGWIAVVWMVDCFVGFYLTLPRGRPFWPKWRPAWRIKTWKIKTGANAYRFNLDLHRASGLWLWLVMFTLAFSSIELNLGATLFRPVVGFFSPVTPTVFETRKPAKKAIIPAVDFSTVIALAEAEARKLGWQAQPSRLIYIDRYGLYRIVFGGRMPVGLGNSILDIDGKTGDILDRRAAGVGSAGDLLVEMQLPLHSGQIAGLPGRILISLSGLVLATLSITGVVIWWKKRQTRAIPRHARNRLLPARLRRSRNMP